MPLRPAIPHPVHGRHSLVGVNHLADAEYGRDLVDSEQAGLRLRSAGRRVELFVGIGGFHAEITLKRRKPAIPGLAIDRYITIREGQMNWE